jgi:hypothetical protein
MLVEMIDHLQDVSDVRQLTGLVSGVRS